ncbi:MAG: helix-turn-helix domain-containing protein [Oscillospiraceae bacterium]
MHLKELREIRGITQQQLADMLGIQRNTVSRYETGDREPDQATLVAIAKILNTSIDYLLTGDNLETYGSADFGTDAADFGKRLFAAHGDIAPEDFSQDDIDDVVMFLQLKKMKKVKKDDD